MPLKVELKPHERIIIGESIIMNGDTRSVFTISGEAPVLREKDILSTENIDSPARKIYFAVQLMYIENDINKYLQHYNEYCSQYLVAAPSAKPIIDALNICVADEALYKALKAAKKLITHEQELLHHVTGI